MIFRGQLQRIHDYMFHIAVAIVIFISGFIIAYSNLPKPSFEFSTFVEQQEKFKQCVNNEALFLSAKGFENSYATLSLDPFKTNLKHCVIRSQVTVDHFM